MDARIMKYNPAFLSREELVEKFVVRHTELDLVVRAIRENTGQSNQHLLVIGPRGSGKTMLVLRAAEEVRRQKGLSERWYPLVFAEESYQVTTPGEFWLEAIFHLAQKTQDPKWKAAHEELQRESDENRLRERALAQLLDFADAQGKRLLLVVENLNMLLGEQMTDDDGWVLRHTFLHEARIMLLTTATSRFEQIDNANKPMFELFRTVPLEPVTKADCCAVWRSVSGEELTERRIRPIQILTGGNPRLLAIISSFGAHRSFRQLMEDLMQLVDDHTEYFKSHLDSLAPTERKVYLALAEVWDPASTRKVAKVGRLGVNKTSSLLGRLRERGAVLEKNGSARRKLYEISERMYNIYYLMRRNGAPSRRVKGVVNFMTAFYPGKDLVRALGLMAEEACELAPDARKDHYLAYEQILRCTRDRTLRWQILHETPETFFKEADAPSSLRKMFVEETAAKSIGETGPVHAVELLRRAISSIDKCGDARQEEMALREALRSNPDSPELLTTLSLLLLVLGNRTKEAEDSARQAIAIDAQNHWAWVVLALSVSDSPEREKEAESAFCKAVELSPESGFALTLFGWFLHHRAHAYEQAEQMYRRALDVSPTMGSVWVFLGDLYCTTGRYKEAEQILEKAIEIDPQFAFAWRTLGWAYTNLRRLEEAEGAFRKSTTLDPKDWLAWTGLGILLHEDRGCYDEAQQAYRRAIDLVPDEDLPWWALGRLLDEKLDSYEEAERAYRKALECDPEYAPAWVSLGKLLHTKLARYAEAENAYRKAVELQPEYPDTYILLGLLLQEGFRRYEDAEQAYRKAISLSPHLGGAYAQLGRLLHKEMKRYSEAEIAYEQAVHLEPLVSVIWQWRLELAMERADGVTRVLDLLGKVLAAHPKEVGLRNDLAWEVYRLRALPFLEQAAVWARQAVDLAPEDPYCRHTLASILCLSGRYEEALQEARKYLENGRALQDTLADTISLFVGFAASGCAREALDVLHDQPTTEELEPLTVALRLCVGEDVNVATEIMEVAKDVVTRIEERRAELESLRAAQDQQDTGPTSCDSGNAKNASDK